MKVYLNIIIPIGFTLSFLSCIQPNDETIPSTFNPRVVKTEGTVISKNQTSEPKVILVDSSKLKIIPVGKPKIVRLRSNTHLAGYPRIVVAGEPRVCIPGQDSFLIPKKVLAIDSPFLAGIPEVVLVKDATIRDPNPQNLTSFGPLQGLKQSNVSCMLEDKFGNLWISINSEGVSKYDGKYFSHFTMKEGLSHNFIGCMLEDKSGNLWFGTNGGGLTKYDGKHFTHFKVDEGLSNNYVTHIQEDKSGNIWLGTFGGGAMMYDGKYFTNFTMKEGLSGDCIVSLFIDSHDNVWFSTTENVDSTETIVSKYDGNKFHHFTKEEGLSSIYITSILEDRSGNLWFGSAGSGIIKFDGKSFSNITDKEGLSSNDVTSILEDRSGNLWVGTPDKGVNKYDGQFFTYLTNAEGLSHDRVWNILEDKSGNLWFGTAFGGVNKYEGKSFTHLTTKEGLNSDEIVSIFEDRSGNLWFGTAGGGINIYDGRTIAHFGSDEGFSNFNVMNIFEDRIGNLWFGTWGEFMIKYDGQFFTHFSELGGIEELRSISSITEDKKGNIWFGASGKGVMKYDGKSFTFFIMESGLSGGIVRCMHEDKFGNMWFGTWGGGLNKYDGTVFTHYTEKEGLPNNIIRTILEDKSGNLWLGTWGGGVIKFKDDVFTIFTEKEGLSHNSVVSAFEDSLGNLWFGTRFGLSKISSDQLAEMDNHPEQFKGDHSFFDTYTYEDGFLGIGCRANSLCQDKKGIIWIGANDRLTAFNPQKAGQVTDTLVPTIQITGLQLFNENIPWPYLEQKKDSILILPNGIEVSRYKFENISKWYGLPEHLSLTFNNNNITFKYVGITMHRPNKVRYQYMLEGFDKNWNANTDRTEANYGNLPQGSYTFRVKAMNANRYWSNENQYSFTIRPPWWKTWWAYTMYGFFSLTVINSGLRIQKQRTIKAEGEKARQKQAILNERLRISRDLHDEVGATLSGIVMYSHLAKSQAKDGNQEVKHSLDIVQETASEMVNKLNDVVWLVNPDQDTLEKLIEKLEDYAGKATETQNIEFKINMPEKIDTISLPVEVRKNLYLFCKEAINNAVKYSKGTQIEFSVSQFDHVLELSIKDNGIGFEPETVKRGNGLNNLQQRAEEIGADFSLSTKPGMGTLLQLKYKIT